MFTVYLWHALIFLGLFLTFTAIVLLIIFTFGVKNERRNRGKKVPDKRLRR
jgi:uncharacterized membrane protein